MLECLERITKTQFSPRKGFWLVCFGFGGVVFVCLLVLGGVCFLKVRCAVYLGIPNFQRVG